MTPAQCDAARMKIWLGCQDADPAHELKRWRDGAVICDACFAKVTALEERYEAVQRIEKLETALKELEGFARRNEERAKKAAEVARVDVQELRSAEGPKKALLEAEARYHEAVRVHQVIKLRVEEALHEK